MRPLSDLTNLIHPDAPPPSEEGGCYRMRSATDPATLRIIASIGFGWDHVSVSTAYRCPTWAEMEQVKRAFFLPTETAVQFHVPPSEHVNVHPYCLHLWRYQSQDIARPPSWMLA